jgi:hypothetical protein
MAESAGEARNVEELTQLLADGTQAKYLPFGAKN